MSKFAPHHKSHNNPVASSSTICQKCLKTGHFTYQCKNPRPYVSRPSRTQLLENPRALDKLKASGKPSVEVPEEFKTKTGIANKILESKEKEREKEIGGTKKRQRSSHSSSSGSDSETDSSSSESDSGSDSSSDSGSESDSGASSDSRSLSRARKRRRARSRSRS